MESDPGPLHVDQLILVGLRLQILEKLAKHVMENCMIWMTNLLLLLDCSIGLVSGQLSVLFTHYKEYTESAVSTKKVFFPSIQKMNIEI